MDTPGSGSVDDSGDAMSSGRLTWEDDLRFWLVLADAGLTTTALS